MSGLEKGEEQKALDPEHNLNEVPQNNNPESINRIWHQKVIKENVDMKFKFMTYNILADVYAKIFFDELYKNIPLQFITWPYRFSLIIKEIIHHSPDIISLQEVEHYYDIYNALKKHGYEGIYLQRTGDRKDGCATFWKPELFKLYKRIDIKYNEANLKDNVALIVIFEYKGHYILTANTHIIFNPKRGDIKLAQVRVLFERINDIMAAFDKDSKPFVIIGGDFNIEAYSKLYDFITMNTIDFHMNFKDISRANLNDSSNWRNTLMFKFNANVSINDKNTVDNSGVIDFTDLNKIVSRENKKDEVKKDEMTYDEEYSNTCVSGTKKQNTETSENDIVKVDIKVKVDDLCVELSEAMENVTKKEKKEIKYWKENFKGSRWWPDSESKYFDMVMREEEKMSEKMARYGGIEKNKDWLNEIEDLAKPPDKKSFICKYNMKWHQQVFNPGEKTLTLPGYFGWKLENYQIACGLKKQDLFNNMIINYLIHFLNLKSAYKDVICKEPFFTSYHLGGKDAIDYIFYIGNKQDCISSYEMMPSKVLMVPNAFQMTPLPNQYWGSDHISLIAEFIIQEKTNENNNNDSGCVNYDKIANNHIFNMHDKRQSLKELLDNQEYGGKMEQRRFYFNDYYGARERQRMKERRETWEWGWGWSQRNTMQNDQEEMQNRYFKRNYNEENRDYYYSNKYDKYGGRNYYKYPLTKYHTYLNN